MNLMGSLTARFLTWLRMRRYDEWTYGDYLRAQGFKIGRNNRLYTRVFGTEPYLVSIGNHCTITAGVNFITHDGGTWVLREEFPDINVFGKIEIRDNCFIGAGSTILPGVTIGPNSVVGAASVVTRNVPPGTVAAGVPARVICGIEEYREKSLRKWQELGLTGSRKEWKDQLIRYFWENKAEGQGKGADNVP